MAEITWLSTKVSPCGPKGSKILIVGEAPGEHEVEEKAPFVGPSGQILMNCLGRAGVARDDVRLANLCNYRPYGNKFENVIGTPVMIESLKELFDYIKEYRPNVIAALGNHPLSFLTKQQGIKKWRGSILSYRNDESIKVIPTIHPAAVLRDHSLYPVFDLDIKRIVQDATYPDKRLPERQFIIDPTGLDSEEWVERLCSSPYLAIDIETVKRSRRILCVGFSPSADIAVCFVPTHETGRRAIERILRSNSRKCFQFGTFDTTQLKLNGFEIRDPDAEAIGRPYWWDTLNAQHTLAPELPRSLEFLTSIYTREPYYKTVGRGTIPDDEKGWSERVEKQSLYEYNCRDCCCTYEIMMQQMIELDQEPATTQAIFNFSMQSIAVATHIADAGMPIDDDRRAVIEQVLIERWVKKQRALNGLTNRDCNVRSPKLKEILYNDMKLPVRKKDGRPTTDEDAIVSLITYCKDKVDSLKRTSSLMDWQIKLAICKGILEIRGIRQVLSNYIIKKKKNFERIVDGRLHSTYKTCGTETGRWASQKYVDGTGFNAQTLPRDPWEIPDALLKQLSEKEDLELRSIAADLEAEDEDDAEEAA